MDELHLAARYVEIIAGAAPELVNKPISILDIGCGMGIMPYLLNQTFPAANVMGIDKNAELIQHAADLYHECTFQQADACSLPFCTDSFDLVVMAQVMHHLPFNARARCINEIFRVLKPEGKFILLESNPWNFFTHKEFKQNHEEQDIRMLSPLSAYKLVKLYKPVLTFYYFHRTEKMRFLLSYLPFGNIYAIMSVR
jgi:ubiquinone/menaquinone biosynthesis C-methylase UbiE